MKYFLHDSNAFNDEKISELFMKFGYEGLGLFYTVLEKIASQEKPIKTVVLKKQLLVGKRLEKCWNFMEQIELISSSNGDTFNVQLLNFSEKYQIKKQKNAERISRWRDNQQVTENVTHSEYVRNAPKVKESKVNRSKVLFIPPTIDEVKDYCHQNNYTEELAQKAFKHYDISGWKDTNGKEVKNWKQKISTNWFKDEFMIKNKENLFTDRKMVY